MKAGREAEKRAIVLRLVEARFGPLPATTVKRIKGAKVAQLDRYLERVLDAASLDELFAA